jgi:opacity protein-like surface antigen
MAPANGTAVRRSTLFSSLSHIHSVLITSVCIFPLLAASAGAMAQTTSVPSSSNPTHAAGPAPDETTKNRDVALSGFGEITRNVNGNFILQKASISGGGLFSFRQSPHPFVGYELNYGYTRFTDTYTFSADTISHGMSELSAAYLIQAPPYNGIQAFGTIGAGLVIQSPSSTTTASGQRPSTATSPAFVFGLGINVPNMFGKLGLRIQYHGVRTKSPDFGVPSLDTHRLRTTHEPAVGVYYRF